MATKFYFRLNEVAGVTPTVRGTWDDTSEAVNRKMHTVKENSAITIGQTVDLAATGNSRDLDRIYISEPMSAGIGFVTTDTVIMQLMVREFAATDNVDSIHIGLFVVSEDGATLRATLLATNDYHTRAEFINNATCRNKTAANGDALGANYTTVAGDRLQLEIGYRVASGGGTTPQAAAKWGDNATDLPQNETQTTDGAGWFELSRNITFSVTLTPAPVTAAFSVPAPFLNAGIQAKIVDFLTGTGAVGTTIPVTGVGFPLQAAIFFAVGETGSVNVVGRGTQRRMIGFAVAPSGDDRAVANNGTDNVDPTADVTIGGRHTNANSVVMMTTGGGTDGEAKLQSVESDGFTLEITNQFAVSYRVFALCLSGFENVKGGNFQEPSGTGDFDVTDAGFSPDAVLVISQMGSGTPPTTQSDARIEFGAFTSNGDEGVIGLLTDRGSTNRHGKGLMGESLKVIAEATKTTETRATFVQMLSNGFRLNFSERIVSQRHHYYIAFKGGAWKVGSLLTRTDGNNIVVSGIGVEPKATIFASHCRAEDPVDSNTTAHDRFSFGAATSATNRAAIGTEDQDAQNPTVTTRGMRFDAIYQRVAGGANVGLMDLVSNDATGFTTVMDDTDPDAAFVLYVTVGKLSTAVTLTPSPVTASMAIAAPTIAAGALSIAPAAIAAAWSVPAPVLLAPLTLTPAAVSASWSVPAPTVFVGQTMTPAPVVATLSVAAPAVVAGGFTLTPGAVVASWSVPAATVALGGVTLSPGAASASWSVPAAVVVPGGVTISPAPVQASWSVPAPSLALGGVTLSPASVSATWSIPPASFATGGVSLTPAAVLASWSVPTPSVLTGGNLAPDQVVATFSIAAPAVLAGSVVLSPSPIAAAWASPVAAVLIGAIVLTPGPVIASWSVPAAVIQAGLTTYGQVASVSIGDVGWPEG